MAKIVGKARVNFELTVALNEAETRALDALVGYGDDAFLAKFKESLGSYYIRDHEQGLREFFKTIRQIVPGELAKLDRARKEFDR